MATDTESETINDYTDNKLSRNNSINSIHNLSDIDYDDYKDSAPNTPVLTNSIEHPQFIPISYQNDENKSDCDSHIIHQPNHDHDEYQLKEMDNNDEHPMEVVKHKKVTKIISRTTTINGIPQETETQEYTLHDSHNHEVIPISTRRSDHTSCLSDITEKQDKENLSDNNSPNTQNEPTEEVDGDMIKYSNYDQKPTEVDDLVSYRTYNEPKQHMNELDDSDVDLKSNNKPLSNNNGDVTDGSIESDKIKPKIVKNENVTPLHILDSNNERSPSVPIRHKHAKKPKTKPKSNKSQSNKSPNHYSNDLFYDASKREKSPSKYPMKSIGTDANYEPIDIINTGDIETAKKPRHNDRYFHHQDLADDCNENNDSGNSEKGSLKWRDPLKSNHLKYDDKNKDLYDWIKAKRIKLLAEKREQNFRNPIYSKLNNGFGNGTNENNEFRNPHRDRQNQTLHSRNRFPIENGFRKASLSPTRRYPREASNATQKSLMDSLNNRRTEYQQNQKPINGSNQRSPISIVNHPVHPRNMKNNNKERSFSFNLNNGPSTPNANSKTHPSTHNNVPYTSSVNGSNYSPTSNARSHSPDAKSRLNAPNMNGSRYSDSPNNRSYSPNAKSRQHGLNMNGSRYSPTPNARSHSQGPKNRADQPSVNGSSNSPNSNTRAHSPSAKTRPYGSSNSPTPNTRPHSQGIKSKPDQPSVNGTSNSPSSNARVHSPSAKSRPYGLNMNGSSSSPTPNARSYSPVTKSKPDAPSINGSRYSASPNNRSYSPSPKGRPYLPTQNNKLYTISRNKPTRTSPESDNDLKVELYKILDRFDTLEKKLDKQNGERTKSPSTLSTSSTLSNKTTTKNDETLSPLPVFSMPALSSSPSTASIINHHIHQPAHCFCCQCHVCCLDNRHHHHHCHRECHKHHYAWCDNYVPLSCNSSIMNTIEKNPSLSNTNRSIDSGYQPSRLNSLRSSARFSSFTRQNGSVRSSLRSNSLRRTNSFSAGKGILGY